MEFNSTVHYISFLESYCKEWVRDGKARVLTDKSQYLKKDNGQTDRVNNKFYTASYLIPTTKWDSVFDDTDIVIRFWYDRRYDRAGVKLTMESFKLLLSTMTVSGWLRTMGVDVKLFKQHVDYDLVEKLLQALIVNEGIAQKSPLVNTPSITVIPGS